MTRVNVMNITPKELAERIVRWNTVTKTKKCRIRSTKTYEQLC